MAKSRRQIITDINAKIVPNGNIKATETNTILQDILNCTELNGQSSIDTFSFKSANALSDTNDEATLNYSIRGIKDLFVNIIFKIENSESGIDSLIFAHENPEIHKVLKNIINVKLGGQIDFLVKIENKEDVRRNFRIGSLNFVSTPEAFKITIVGPDLKDILLNGDRIFTSFTIHCPNKF